MKFLNFDSKTSEEKRKVQLQEHEEMWLNAYELSIELSVNLCDLVHLPEANKWLEAIASATNDAKIMIKSLKRNIFARFRVPRLSKVLQHYDIRHKVAPPYHPQTNGWVKVSNREIKRILEKTVATSRKNWAAKLDDCLWAYITAFKTPIGLSLFQLVYEKACHLPVELEIKAHLAVKFLNFDSTASGEKRKVQLQELKEMCLNVYESSKLYKERTKRYHNKKILHRESRLSQILLYNSRLKLFPKILKSRWSGPFIVKDVKTCEAIEIEDQSKDHNWLVNGQRLKIYLGGEVPQHTIVIKLKYP